MPATTRYILQVVLIQHVHHKVATTSAPKIYRGSIDNERARERERAEEGSSGLPPMPEWKKDRGHLEVSEWKKNPCAHTTEVYHAPAREGGLGLGPGSIKT